MDFGSYIVLFVIVVVVCISLRLICEKYCCKGRADQTPGVRRRVIRQIRIDPAPTTATRIGGSDRQGNVLTIHDETSRENRYNDIFFIEPNSIEAARIRAQLEKDEKDLPSYEEVMRMANLSSPTAAPAPAPLYGGAVSMTASSSSVNTTETTLTVPEYTEVDLSSGPVTPPPYSPPTAAAGAVVILPSTNNLHTQHITSSNV